MAILGHVRDDAVYHFSFMQFTRPMVRAVEFFSPLPNVMDVRDERLYLHDVRHLVFLAFHGRERPWLGVVAFTAFGDAICVFRCC